MFSGLSTPSEPDAQMPQYREFSEYDGTGGFIQTGGLAQPPVYSAILEQFGYNTDEVKIVGTLKTSRWQQRSKVAEDEIGDEGDPGYRTVWLTAYKFSIAPTGKAGIEDILAHVKARKPVKISSTGKLEGEGGVFDFLIGDLQLGKIDGDGVQGTVDAVLSSVDKSVEEFKRLRKIRPLSSVQLSWLGDCGEGNVSQGGRNMWRTCLTVTEQYRVFRRLMLYAVDQFRSLSDDIGVNVVNGNHDQVQRFQETRGDDGHATEAAVAFSDALAMNPDAYGHVNVHVPNLDSTYMTRAVGSSIYTYAHGHQWSKAQHWKWWSGQALNWQHPGSSHFLVHGHTHTFFMDSKKDRLVVAVPPMESKSTWWYEKTGDLAKRGAVIMCTENGEFSDLRIV